MNSAPLTAEPTGWGGGGATGLDFASTKRLGQMAGVTLIHTLVAAQHALAAGPIRWYSGGAVFCKWLIYIDFAFLPVKRAV